MMLTTMINNSDDNLIFNFSKKGMVHNKKIGKFKTNTEIKILTSFIRNHSP